MSKLYIFGDSYSTPGFCVDPKDSWWALVYRAMQAHNPDMVHCVDNYSWLGNNIDSIAHIIVSNISMFDTTDYVIIGVPPIERLTAFNSDAKIKTVVKFDRDLVEFRCDHVTQHESLEQLTLHQVGGTMVNLWNRSWQEAQILRELLLLEHFLKDHVAGVIVVNLSKPFQPLTQWMVLKSLQQMVLDKPNFIIFDQTYYSANKELHKPVDFETYGWHGHQGPAGNKHWFDVALLPCMKNIGWV